MDIIESEIRETRNAELELEISKVGKMHAKVLGIHRIIRSLGVV